MLLLLFVQGSVAQIYDQAVFLNKMPKIPQTVIGITDEEKEVFEAQIRLLENYLDSLERNYKHPMCSIEKSSQQEMFEFNEIWEELYRLHDAQFEYHTKIAEEMGALAQQEFDNQAGLSAKLRKIRSESVKSMKDISGEENQIDKEMYENHALYNQKQADLLTKSINHYRVLIDGFALKTKRADTILLAVVAKGTTYPCAAIANAKYFLSAYKGYSTLFVPPYTPKF
jgi:hypothetical protein